MGSDMTGMLDKQMKGEMDSWAIRWCYHQFRKQSFTVYPVFSKVKNNGFGEDATHTREHINRYDTVLDNSSNFNFNFNATIELDPLIVKQFTKHYSLRFRIFYKLLNLLLK